ncbi:sec-independent protein translocase protein TatC [Aeromicrobium panaciterrae]|uniref:Sec-independent protein translocase protein TatC n=1 Tax=Aeromicrobium panaciterrae TaxID=363861 RepID=A0ABU1UP13_9ACTN|nr:twin-arginine translocase subunit TatC [Aeromicrobium panaciterrae]MDR7086924.1 sec-independent protein translocase protein TatC [Aeromicrobium panaciterrae]
MPLVEHLRELRRRLIIAVLAILIGTIVGWILYPSAFDFLKQPYVDGIAPLLERKGFDAKLVLSGGVGSAFSFRLKFALVIGLVISAPVWIGQIWAFVLPALHHNERRWAYLLTAIGAPLFAGGVVVGYLVLPKGIEVLIGFAPESIDLLLTLGDYLNFVVRTVLVFGIAAQIPLVVILLNRLGVVSGRQLASARPWTVIGIFVFAAVATPSTDPLTMLFLAVPMVLLYLVSEVIARVTDRRKAQTAPEELSDDEASPLD